MPAYRALLAETLSDFGVLQLESRPKEAEQTLGRSIAIWKDLVAKFSEAPSYRVLLGGALHNLALVRATHGDLPKARPLYEEAILHQERAVKIDPLHPSALEFLSNHRSRLAKLLQTMGEPQEAERTMLRQKALAQELAAKDGKAALVRIFQARTCEDLAYILRGNKQSAEAVAAFREAADLRRRLAADYPKNSHNLSWLGAILNDWANIPRAERRWADMIPLADEAIKVQEAAVRAWPEEQSYQQFLYTHYCVRTDAGLPLGDHARAFATARALRERFPDRFEDFVWAQRLALCIPVAKKDAHLKQAERDQLIREYADESIVLLRAAQEKKAKDLPQIHTHPAFAPLRGRADFSNSSKLSQSPPSLRSSRKSRGARMRRPFLTLSSL